MNETACRQDRAADVTILEDNHSHVIAMTYSGKAMPKDWPAVQHKSFGPDLDVFVDHDSKFRRKVHEAERLNQGGHAGSAFTSSNEGGR